MQSDFVNFKTIFDDFETPTAIYYYLRASKCIYESTGYNIIR